MHFEYIRFREPVQAPGKGGNNNTSYRVGDLSQGIPQSHLHSIHEQGDWIVLVNKGGQQRLSPRENVVDASPETAETAQFREHEAEMMAERGKAQTRKGKAA